MANPDAPEPNGTLLGRLAVHYKMITMDQLAAVTEELGRPFTSKRLGDLLVEKGWMRVAQLDQLLRVQQHVVAKERAKRTGTSAATPGAAPMVAPQTEDAGVAVSPDPSVPSAEGSSAAAKALGLGATPQDSTSTPAGTPTRTRAGAAASANERPSSPSAVSPAPPVRAAVSDVRTSMASAMADPNARSAIEHLLADAVAKGASDVHVHAGVPLRFRRHGKLLTLGDTPLARERSEAMMLSLLDATQREVFLRDGEIDLCLTIPNVGRFRSNLYHQQRGIDGVFRAIPPTPPTLEELGLPSTLAKLVHYHQGMVLVTGPAGCGKSSTMAALVNLVNEERRDHILTIEDPIEYLHPSKRCIVNQRSVKRHTESFARALRAALREDPDVIVIGELRDLETISLAMTAAETGHFVLGTLHTNDTIRTINRLVGSFPSDQQGQVRTMLSESLRAVLSQRLVTTAEGDRRVPATELLIVNKAIGNLIRENKTFQIRSMLQTGAAQGMCLLDQSLAQLIANGTITREEAARHAEDAKKLAA